MPTPKPRQTLKGRIRSALPWSLWGPLSRLQSGRWCEAWRFRRQRVGDGCYIDPGVQVLGWRNVVVGSNTLLSEGVWLNVNHRTGSDERIVIGSHCHIGRNNFFSSGPLIRLGDYCFTGMNCQFLGCGHVIDSPMIPYIDSGLTEGATIDIGTNCWLATDVTVMQGVRIGRGSVIGAHAMVLEDIPPFSLAVGNPARVIKRFDFRKNQWLAIDACDDGLDAHAPGEDEYLAALRQSHPTLPLHFLAGSRRFGWL